RLVYAAPDSDVACLLIFFVSSARRHRALHSFPTRRSSDLIVSVAFVVAAHHAGSAYLDLTVLRDPHIDIRDRASNGADLGTRTRDRKSTRLNSSHLVISYAVFCLKKKKLPCNRHKFSHGRY